MSLCSQLTRQTLPNGITPAIWGATSAFEDVSGTASLRWPASRLLDLSLLHILMNINHSSRLHHVVSKTVIGTAQLMWARILYPQYNPTSYILSPKSCTPNPKPCTRKTHRKAPAALCPTATHHAHLHDKRLGVSHPVAEFNSLAYAGSRVSGLGANKSLQSSSSSRHGTILIRVSLWWRSTWHLIKAAECLESGSSSEVPSRV